ncbi:MAG: tRNA lysidine(34) synthetase TilS [Desulfobacca sp. RBG_16_58_9]|nr:MAG: tRNA lysidine(34) synthetase TilS [Desulfobacca sp. RBG_16_58_9]
MPYLGSVIPPLMEGAIADLPQWVSRYVRQENLFAAGDRVLAAVSGGPDSVALLHLLHSLQPDLDLELGVAHFDHSLRGRQSQEEAEFVAALAQSLSLPFYPGQGDTRESARRERISLQMAARRLRLQFLKDICRSHRYQKLALGHTADDQVELFFLRLLRGAGPEGLAGMPPATPEGLVRPLLAVGKEVILAWLLQGNLPYRQDPSNLKREYLRNRVRLDLLPQLKQYNPRVREAVWRAQALLQEGERLLAPRVARAVAEVGEALAPDFYRLNLPRFLQLPVALQKLVLRAVLQKILAEYPLSAAQVAAVLDLAQAKKSGGQVSLGTCRVARAGGELYIFLRLPAPPRHSATLPSCPGRFQVGGWNWHLVSRPYLPETPWPQEAHLAWLDRDRVHFPLEIRYFQPGDRFWPTGAAAPRKLQDFLVDCKIPRWLRPYIPLVISQGQIIWVPGLRLAEPLKLTGASRNLLAIELSPGSFETRRLWEMLQACRQATGDTKNADRQKNEAP